MITIVTALVTAQRPEFDKGWFGAVPHILVHFHSAWEGSTFG